MGFCRISTAVIVLKQQNQGPCLHIDTGVGAQTTSATHASSALLRYLIVRVCKQHYYYYYYHPLNETSSKLRIGYRLVGFLFRNALKSMLLSFVLDVGHQFLDMPMLICWGER